MEQMPRVLIFDRTDTYLCDLDPERALLLKTIEELNGEHSLTIRTTQELAKTNRVLVCDGMNVWHEYVIVGTSEQHGEQTATINEYYCVWSLQYDLSATFINDQYGAGVVPGHASTPVSATQALTVALEGTSRWAVGTVGVTAKSSASFYRRSGWDGIKTVLEKWGGELDTTITVSTTGVVSRAVDLLTHVGASTAARRFDYGSDLTSIKRTISDDVWPCRIVPLGASQETDAGGYTRRPSIESVNGGVIWLQDDAVVPYVRIPDGSGGWEYPTVIIENDTYEQPADLKAWALAHISEYTRPQVSYEADVLQLARAGLDPHGVALGDEVVVVDRTFGTDGLRISARVVKMVTNLLGSSDITLTIGNARSSLAGQLGDLSRAVSDLAEQVASASQWQSGEDYVSALIARINDEANATGGYTYITEGQGTRTYDVAVSDPLVGTEASMVVEIKGGNIRIANTKDSQGNWEWKTMLQSGYVNSEVLRAIGSGSGGIAEVTANGFLIYLGQALMAAFMADAVKFYDGLGTALTNIIAQFGASGSRVGYSNGYHVDMNSGGIDLYNADNNRTLNINNDIELLMGDYGGGIDFCPDSTLGVASLEGAVSQRTLHTTPMAMEQLYTKIGTSTALVRLRTSGTTGSASSDIYIGVSRDTSTDTSYYLTFDPLNGLRLYAPLYTQENIHTDGSIIYVDNGQAETRTYLQAVEGSESNTTRLGTHRSSYGVDVYNNLNLTIDDEGNRSVGVSEVAPWLKTFGLDGTGDLLTANPSAVNVSTSSWSTLGSITVTQGIWVFSISTTFASNASGRRAVFFGTSSTGTSITVGAMGSSTMAPADGGMTKYSNCHIGQVSVSTTYYCRAWQNSGSTLSCQCYLRAVRIK